MDEGTLAMLQKLSPDLVGQIYLRALALDRVAALQPVGRRALAHRMKLPEREVRSLCDALRDAGFLAVNASGMALTAKAETVLEPARALVRSLSDLAALESALAKALGAGRVVVVPGDADSDPNVLAEVGRAAAQRLVRLLSDGMTLTVSGGTTVAAVARAIPSGTRANVRVVPARGSMGTEFETQAGTLAAEFAAALGGVALQLHVPDSIRPDTLRQLLVLPEIGGAIEALRQTDILLCGIGRADVMATYRGFPRGEVEEILRRGAVAEAVGCYFGPGGELLFHASGIDLIGERLLDAPTVIAVAAGAAKARAILAAARHHRHDLLVLDEQAARAILALVSAERGEETRKVY